MYKNQKIINKNTLADVEFRLKWKSSESVHTDASLVMVNFWRDLLPEKIFEGLSGCRQGDMKIFRFAAGQLIPGHKDEYQYRIKRSNFNEVVAKPAFGRFYPKGVIKGLTNVFSQNVAPTRCVGIGSETVVMDMNHPLAGYEIEVTAIVHKIYQKPFDRGGQCKELTQAIASGPGMQARYKGIPTDFYIPGAFRRQDEKPDRIFYETPRMVNHIDDRAIRTIAEIYKEFITSEMKVLDLMSSLYSHLPDDGIPKRLVGLGMNAREMEENMRLDESVVHDLNECPRLPFEDNSFDMVICTASVEYLTNPAETFKDTARILKPGAMLIHTFSNRWFPPKTIQLWTQLHEFERLGLVLDYFLKTGEFTELTTFSVRGWDRPETDKYYPDIPASDPVFAVWGRKK